MKRFILLFLVTLISIYLLASCDFILPDGGDTGSDGSDNQSPDDNGTTNLTPPADNNDQDGDDSGEAPVHSHAFGPWQTVTEATCGADGTMERSCECGEKESNTIDATGNHTFGDWQTLTEAGCFTEGAKERSCACGEKESDSIPAIGSHSPGAWVVTSMPDDTTDGLVCKSCSLCGESLEEIALPHGVSYNDASEFAYSVNPDGDSCTVTKYLGGNYSVSVPYVIDGYLVTAIGDDAFYEASITHFTMPDSVRYIGNSALYGNRIDNVYISKNVTEIGTRAFGRCRSLTAINVDSENEYYASVNGDLYTKDGKILLQYAIGKTKTSFTAPEGVTVISAGAFEDSQYLKNVTLYEGVQSIEKSAFEGCSALQYIILPNGLTDIGDSAFSDCRALNSAKLPETLVNIGRYCFYGCESLSIKTLPSSLESVGFSAFYGCKIPNYNLHDGAFYLGNDTNPYLILMKAKNTEITSHSVHQDTKLIYGDAFISCTSFTSITIPDGVKFIGERAFSSCSALTNVVIPDSVSFLGFSAFGYCTSLKTAHLSAGLTEISGSLFYGCRSLVSVYVPDSITVMGDTAFVGCSECTLYYGGSEGDLFVDPESEGNITIIYNHK